MEIQLALDTALQTIWDDAKPEDALAVYEFLVANMTAGEVSLFRDEVAARVKRDYMKTYMQSRRAALVREKAAKRETSA